MSKILPGDDEACANYGCDEIVNNFDDEDEGSEFINDFEEHMSELTGIKLLQSSIILSIIC